MGRKRYSKELRIRVAKEACQPANDGLEHIIAEKYGLRRNTVVRWKEAFLEYGEASLGKGVISTKIKSPREKQLEKENAALREEVEILKKAAAFLANVKRD